MKNNLAPSSNWNRSPAFHAGNPGSSPGGVTIKTHAAIFMIVTIMILIKIINNASFQFKIMICVLYLVLQYNG